MPTGISLHIGLNAVDPNHYSGWDGALVACEADALDMQLIANTCGLTSKILLTTNATRKNVIAAIAAAQKQLKNGDYFLLTYSGHGGQLPDQDNDEPDALDETWCLFDGELIDDELYRLWEGFKGVRIFVLSDSCHSGTVLKDTLLSRLAPGTKGHFAYRAMPSAVALRTYLQNKAFYDQLLVTPSPNPKGFNCTVRLLSGCQDNQLSADGTFNGLFTGHLKRVWNGGKFNKPYADFANAIIAKMPRNQTPNHMVIGKSDPVYDSEKPFQI